MITPNMFAQVGEISNWVRSIVEEELLKQDEKRLISVVAILEIEMNAQDSRIRYVYTEYPRAVGKNT